MTWYRAGNDVSKQFTCDKNTAAITVIWQQWNQWGPAGGFNGSCELLCHVKNITKGTEVDFYKHPVEPNSAIYFPVQKQFNIACDLGDVVEVHFLTPDAGNAYQRARIRNVTVQSDALGDIVPA